MATDMKISRNLFHSKIAFESTPSIFIKAFPGQLHLFFHILLSKKLEILAIVDHIPILIQSEFFNRGYISTMRQHQILQV